MSWATAAIHQAPLKVSSWEKQLDTEEIQPSQKSPTRTLLISLRNSINADTKIKNYNAGSKSQIKDNNQKKNYVQLIIIITIIIISIYKGEVSVCLSVCLSVCPYVRASLEDGESDLGRISLAHAKFIQVESQTAVVFLTSPTTTPFPADRARFRLRANISGTAHRVSTEFRLPVPDVGRYAPSVSSIAGDVGKRKIFLLISGSRKNTHTVVCQSATVEELPCSMHLFPETPATSSKRRRSAGLSK